MIGPKVRLMLQRSTETRDGYGGVSETWSNVRAVEGNLITTKGDESLMADRIAVAVTHHFFCDYSQSFTVTEKDRFVLGTRTFDILLVNNIGSMNINWNIYLKEVK